MMRTERSRLVLSPSMADAPHTMARDLLIAVAPPPRTHVYNLGHGVLPATDPERARELVEFVHASGAEMRRK